MAGGIRDSRVVASSSSPASSCEEPSRDDTRTCTSPVPVGATVKRSESMPGITNPMAPANSRPRAPDLGFARRG